MFSKIINKVRPSASVPAPAAPKAAAPSSAKAAVNTAKPKAPNLSKPKAKQSSLSQVKNIVAVASGKGGVGKSTSCVNLAYALIKKGAKVGVLDADLYGPSVAMMTEAVETDQKAFQNEGEKLTPPVVAGLKIISMAMFRDNHQAAILRGPMAASMIKQFLTQVDWGQLDYLLIDYPPGTGDIQLSLSQLAPIKGAVIITTPQVIALSDVRKAIDLFKTTKIPVLGVIETMSYFYCDNCDKKHELFPTGAGETLAKENSCPLFAQLPFEASVAKSCDEGLPLLLSKESSPTAEAYSIAADLLTKELERLAVNTAAALESFSIRWQN